jgi:hypothetical protein
MPAEQHAHSLTASLSSASRVYLRETSCLWGNIARTACWSGLCHALVSADQHVSQTARENCILLYSLLRVMILHGEERVVHVLHQHVQCFCATRCTVYTAQHLSDLGLSNGLEDFEYDGKVDLLKGETVS